jgi:hypothetical protein
VTIGVGATTGSIVGLSSLQVTHPSSTASSFIDSIAGQYALARFRTGTSARWDIGKTNGPESGSNAGADFFIRRCADLGTVLATSFTISRATGDCQVEGNFAPSSDNAKTCGTASLRWSVIYAGTGTINTSDARAKQDIGPAPDALLDAWGDVAWCQYRFIAAYECKGDDARWHLGLVAQQVRDAIDARLGSGSAIRLGLVCHDDWDAVEATEISPAREAGDLWGLRYDECFALEAAWQRRRMDRIEAQLAALAA